MKINEYLLQFLSTGNKEAAIPGLGVFYTDLHNTVSFREVAPTDRAFIKYVAEKSGVDEMAVASSIDVWVKSILQDLKTMGRAIIDSIGSFEVTGNKVVFSPEMPEIPKVSLRVEKEDMPVEKPADTFGMEDEEDIYAPAPERGFEDDEEDADASFTSKNLWWIILVSVVTLAIIAIFVIPSTREKVISFIISGNDAQVKEVVLGVPSEDGVVAEVEDITIEQPEENYEDNNVSEVAPAPVTPSTSVKEVEKPATPKPAVKSTGNASSTKSNTKPAAATSAKAKGKYNIIAGSFKESQNADKEVQRFRQLGYSNARVVLNGGFYYVSLNNFATRDEALNYKLKLAEKNVQGWIKEFN